MILLMKEIAKEKERAKARENKIAKEKERAKEKEKAKDRDRNKRGKEKAKENPFASIVVMQDILQRSAVIPAPFKDFAQIVENGDTLQGTARPRGKEKARDLMRSLRNSMEVRKQEARDRIVEVLTLEEVDWITCWER